MSASVMSLLLLSFSLRSFSGAADCSISASGSAIGLCCGVGGIECGCWERYCQGPGVSTLILEKSREALASRMLVGRSFSTGCEGLSLCVRSVWSNYLRVITYPHGDAQPPLCDIISVGGRRSGVRRRLWLADCWPFWLVQHPLSYP
jgi:hypothetical protein